jgi:chitinase
MRALQRTAILRVLALCATLALAASATAAEPDAHDQRVLVGYVAGWQARPRIDAEHVSALNYAFAHIAHGRIALDQVGAHDFIAQLRALKSHNPQLKILVSVGGWGADGFSGAALTAESRTAFVDSAVKLLIDEQLDGIDLDWEYPGLAGPGIGHRAEDKQNFTLLLQALRERFDIVAHERAHARYLLTAALADSEFVAHIELDRIHAYLDWIDLMSYDFHNSLTPTTGHHAALHASATAASNERSVERAVAQFLAAGVPAHKLVVGAPFYGRAFADVNAQNHGLDQRYGRYAGDHAWSQLVAQFIGREGYARYWDDVAMAPYLWNAQTRTFISYDDPQSLALKVQYVKAHDLGGMMYWEQSQDPQQQLQRVLQQVLP